MKTLDVIVEELKRQTRVGAHLLKSADVSSPYVASFDGFVNLVALATVIDEFHQPKPPVTASVDYLREVRAA